MWRSGFENCKKNRQEDKNRLVSQGIRSYAWPVFPYYAHNVIRLSEIIRGQK